MATGTPARLLSANAVPEPATLALLIGLGGLAMLKRRR
ncbi:MAG: PEP-CTERM sorting domain-containing protein [Phycisphaerales bacterium]